MTFRRATVPLAVLVLGLASCGSDDDGGGGGGSSASSEPAQVTIELTEQGRGSEISMPAEIEAGATTFALENAGEQPHDAQILRVDGDQTVEQVVQAIEANGEGGPIPERLHAAGGLGTVAPGQSATATDDLEPGTHYALDTSPDRDNGSAKFEVTGGGGPELPSGAAEIAT